MDDEEEDDKDEDDEDEILVLSQLIQPSLLAGAGRGIMDRDLASVCICWTVMTSSI